MHEAKVSHYPATVSNNNISIEDFQLSSNVAALT